MKTHNAVIYHCMSCGNVVHQEPDLATPRCCECFMTKAAWETVEDSRSEPPETPGMPKKSPPQREPRP
jgi:hypothetical protein